ncbi:MAG UNVERIFIED_CONTAM: FAD-binding protein [Planctomycetaceae bacterium]
MTKSIEQFNEILQRDVSLADMTWLRTGGPADYLLTPRTEPELLAVVSACRSDSLPIHILGCGSNLLVRDAGVRGAVIRIADPLLSEIRIDGTSVEAGAAAAAVVGHHRGHACRTWWSGASGWYSRDHRWSGGGQQWRPQR